MASEWAEEADRQAKAMTRDLIETGKTKGFRVEYQKREARFSLRAGTVNAYFSAHDYKSKNGMDWLKLRIDVLSFVRFGGQSAEESAPEENNTEHDSEKALAAE
jgi:hypothetical protein